MSSVSTLRDDLLKSKQKIETALKKYVDSREVIIKELLIIEQKKLYQTEGCNSMSDFMNKNKYQERLQLDRSTIYKKIKSEKWYQSLDTDGQKSADQLPERTRNLLSNKGITENDKIKEALFLPFQEMKKKLDVATREDYQAQEQLLFDISNSMVKKILVNEDNGELIINVNKSKLELIKKKIEETIKISKVVYIK